MKRFEIRKLVTVAAILAISAFAVTGCGSAKTAETAPAAETAKAEGTAAEEANATDTAAEETNATDTAAETKEEAPAAEAAGEETIESIKAQEVDDELARILKEGVFKVGVEGTYPPITFHDEDGTLTGFDVEVAQAIAEKIGVEVEFTETEWDSLLAAVDSGRIDAVVNAVSITEERKQKYDFTEPYVSVYRNIIVKGDNDSIKSLEDLNGTKVAENITTEYADKLDELGSTIVPIDTLQQAFDLVETGRADFTILEDIQFYPYLEQHPEADFKVAFTITDDVDQFAIPLKKGETRLLKVVNLALDELKADGTLSALSQKYFNSDVIEKASIEK